MIYDIETIMDEVADLAKAYIPYYSYLINVEKGDQLLGQLELLTTGTGDPVLTDTGEYLYVSGDPGENGFYPEGYYLWYMTDYPVHKVSFLQAMLGDPTIISNPQGQGEITRYTIALFSFFRENFDSNIMPRIKARYNRMFRRLITDKIAPIYNGVGSIAEKAAILEDLNGNKYELAGVTFTLDIVY